MLLTMPFLGAAPALRPPRRRRRLGPAPAPHEPGGGGGCARGWVRSADGGAGAPAAVELAGALSPVPGQVGGVKLLGEGALDAAGKGAVGRHSFRQRKLNRLSGGAKR